MNSNGTENGVEMPRGRTFQRDITHRMAPTDALNSTPTVKQQQSVENADLKRYGSKRFIHKQNQILWRGNKERILVELLVGTVFPHRQFYTCFSVWYFCLSSTLLGGGWINTGHMSRIWRAGKTTVTLLNSLKLLTLSSPAGALVRTLIDQ